MGGMRTGLSPTIGEARQKQSEMTGIYAEDEVVNEFRFGSGHALSQLGCYPKHGRFLCPSVRPTQRMTPMRIQRGRTVVMTPSTKTVSMERLRFFRPFVILLTLVFVLLGGFLLHSSVLSLGFARPWELLGGAVLFSLALVFACYFLG